MAPRALKSVAQRGPAGPRHGALVHQKERVMKLVTDDRERNLMAEYQRLHDWLIEMESDHDKDQGIMFHG